MQFNQNKCAFFNNNNNIAQCFESSSACLLCGGV